MQRLTQSALPRPCVSPLSISAWLPTEAQSSHKKGMFSPLLRASCAIFTCPLGRQASWKVRGQPWHLCKSLSSVHFCLRASKARGADHKGSECVREAVVRGEVQRAGWQCREARRALRRRYGSLSAPALGAPALAAEVGGVAVLENCAAVPVVAVDVADVAACHIHRVALRPSSHTRGSSIGLVRAESVASKGAATARSGSSRSVWLVCGF